jgi:hypothetical protein
MKANGKRKGLKPGQLCVICGVREAVDMDHTPPECVFPKPLPNHMITVPACGLCNGGNSKADEEFKAYISISAGVDHPKAKLLWEECLKTLKHNKKLYRRIIASIQNADIKTPMGIIARQGKYVPWYLHDHHQAFEKIIRGLYYDSYKEILSQDVKVNIESLSKLPPVLTKDQQVMKKGSIGGDQFVYWHFRFPNEPSVSIWTMQFYCAHTVYVVTTPKNSIEIKRLLIV